MKALEIMHIIHLLQVFILMLHTLNICSCWCAIAVLHCVNFRVFVAMNLFPIKLVTCPPILVKIGHTVKKGYLFSLSKMDAAAILNFGHYIFWIHRCVLKLSRNSSTKFSDDWSNNTEMAKGFQNSRWQQLQPWILITAFLRHWF